MRATPLRATVWLCVPCLAMLVLASGCSGHRTPQKHPSLVSESDAATLLQQAMEAPSADDRREAIVQLRRTKHISRDTVVRGLCVVAETDTSNVVRRTAIGGLAQSGRAEALPTLVAILTQEERRDPLARPATGTVRSEAAGALLYLIHDGVSVSRHATTIRPAAMQALASDPSRETRMRAAELLGHLPNRETLDALVSGLEQSDFGVVLECERSLMRMTGHTHNHDPLAWRAWLAEASDPFADAGRLDAQLERKEPNWLERTWDSTRRSLASYRPKEH
ncbi:MAG: HEAT repeat domain-containing protein [Phycisphaerae bacterium]|nr:HEAT repeat domain-containing protein [Phycisphaerae bacterium]